VAGPTAEKTKKKNSSASIPATTGLLDILSPTALQFQMRNIINGELQQRVIAIIDYPERVAPSWLSRIATLPGVITSIHATPTDPYDLIEQLNVSIGDLEGRVIEGGKHLVVERAKTQLEGAKHLIKKIDAEAQGVFFVTVLILVSAYDQDELLRRCRRVESVLAAAGMRGRAPVFRQEEAFRSVGPYRMLEPEIEQIAARNMPVETLAAMYPFVYSGINDGKGILLGSDKDGGILLVDLWVREGSRTNSNITVLGRPGVGKSTVIKKILACEFAQGTDAIVIDPEREYRDLCKNLGGDWINTGAGGNQGRINPFQIRAVPMDDDDEEDRLFSKEIEGRPLAMHFQMLRTFFQLYLGKSIGELEHAYLEIALEEVYRKKDIIWTTDVSSYANADFPVMEELFYWLEEMTKKESTKLVWEQLMMLVRAAAVGADSHIWNGPTTVKANSGFIVLDTKDLVDASERIQKAQYFNVLGWSWNKISHDRSKKFILAGDEFYLNVDPDNPQVLKFTRNTSKRIRKYEGALMVISHNMNDFMDPSVRRYGQSLLDNPVYKIIMGQGENDIASLTSLMHLSEKEVETLMTGNRGEALFFAGNRRIHAHFEITPEELELFGRGGGR